MEAPSQSIRKIDIVVLRKILVFGQKRSLISKTDNIIDVDEDIYRKISK